MEELCDMLAVILEVDEIKPDDDLWKIDTWDSLSVLSIISMLDKNYGVNLHATDLAEVKSSAELMALVERKRK